MKKIITKALLLAIVALAAASCSFDDTDINSYQPSDPPCPLHFAFAEDGVPYISGASRELTEEMQKNFREQVVGYGWEWVQTHEIQADGYPKIEEYYFTIYGIGASHFYLESEWEAVEYYYHEGKNTAVSHRTPIYIDAARGSIFFEARAIEPPFTRLFDTFSLYKTNGTWHIFGVEYLGQRWNDGKASDIWGWSEYKRMSPARLAEIQSQHQSQ